MNLRTASRCVLFLSVGLSAACGPKPAVEVGAGKVSGAQGRAYLAAHPSQAPLLERLGRLAARERTLLATGVTAQSPAVRDRVVALEAELLTERYLESKFPSQRALSPEKLREAFDRAAEKRDLRHILCATRDEAARLEARLAAGEDFAALARRYSKDAASSAGGGSLGWRGREALDPAFAEAAFSLAVGATSAPVKSPYGFHLIQVLAVRAPSDEEFAGARDAFAARSQEEVDAQLAQMALHALQLTIPITYDEGPIDRDESDLSEGAGDEGATVATVGEAERISLADLKAYMRRYFKGQRVGHTLGGSVKKQFLRELAKERLLLAAARKEGLDRTEEFRARLWDATHDLLEAEARRLYLEAFVPTEDDLREFFRTHRSESSANPEARLRLLAGNDTALMGRLAERLKGAPAQFEEAVRQHSIDRETAKVGGDLGWVGRGALANLVGDEAAHQILTAEAGSVFGPFPTPFGGALIQVAERRAGEPLAFEQVRGRLGPEYTRVLREKILADWDRDLAERYPARFDERALLEPEAARKG